MEKILKVNSVEKYYGGRQNLTKALDQISFEVEKGEFVAIMGASGSGKTTLLNCISTIDRPTTGEITVADQELTSLRGNALNTFRRKKIGFIFQEFNLLDTMTAFENIALALTIAKYPAEKVEKRVREVADKLAISHILNRYPYQMSGGEKQRTAAARAIVTDPKLVLADEPTGALDSRSSKMLLDCLEKLHREESTILMVTHDSFTASYASRVLFIKDGKLFDEIRKGDATRKEFFDRIIEVVTLLGGGAADAV